MARMVKGRYEWRSTVDASLRAGRGKQRFIGLRIAPVTRYLF